MNTRIPPSVLLICLSYIILLEVQSFSAANLNCRCNRLRPMVKEKRIRKLEIFLPGPHCSVKEIIVTLVNKQKICLDPKDPALESFLKRTAHKNPGRPTTESVARRTFS